MLCSQGDCPSKRFSYNQLLNRTEANLMYLTVAIKLPFSGMFVFGICIQVTLASHVWSCQFKCFVLLFTADPAWLQGPGRGGQLEAFLRPVSCSPEGKTHSQLWGLKGSLRAGDTGWVGWGETIQFQYCYLVILIKILILFCIIK